MLNIADISTNLEQHDDGIWYSRTRHPVSYPEDGNRRSYFVEDTSFWFRHRNNCIIDVMRCFPPGGPVLDIGGGNGFVSLALQESGIEPILLEPGHIGAMNARSRGLPVILCATLADAGFRETSVPAAGMFDVVEHIDDDVDFLRSVNRILSPAGRIYLTVPAYNFLFSSDDVEAGHHRRYSLRQLTNTLDSAGFDVEYATYFFFFLPLPILALRTLPSVLGLRRNQSTDHVRQEHRRPPGLSGRIVDLFCDIERRTIGNRGRFRIGGSCLAVGRKR